MKWICDVKDIMRKRRKVKIAALLTVFTLVSVIFINIFIVSGVEVPFPKSRRRRARLCSPYVQEIEILEADPVTFRIDFGRSTAPNLSILFSSDIVEIEFSPGDLVYEPTTREHVKIVRALIPVSGVFRVTFMWGGVIIFETTHNVASVSHVPPGHSSLECFGDKYESRWCRARNICYGDRWFKFFGVPNNTKFNRSIMTPGSRPIPLDYPSCRKSIRFRTTPELFPLANAREVVKDLSYITCRWFSMQYLWHCLFDYTLPLFWTEKLNGGVNKSARIYVIDENTSQKGFQFISAFTDHVVKKLRVDEKENNNTCWENAILGFPKSEYNVTPSKWKTALDLPYEYPLEAFLGFREHMIKEYCGFVDMKSRCEPDPKHPRVLLFMRNSPSRDIVNPEELLDAVEKWCPHCRVDSFAHGNESFCEQMLEVCNASILMGMHGSQMSNMVWMKIGDKKKRTSVIEVLPYGYTCRDWYKQIATGAGIKYFEWLNRNRENTRSGRTPSSLYQRCLNGEYECLGKCHDLLRDQPTIVDVFDFEKVFRNALAYVS